MERIDLVIVGAEGVVESGGIINKVRSTHTSATSDGSDLGKWCRIFTTKLV